jgi:hypothetical protein
MNTSNKSAKKSFATKSGQNTRGAVTLAAAMFKKIETVEDLDGNVLRVWKSFEGNQFTNAQLKECLSNKVAVAAEDFLATVPPAAIKYCVNKGFLIQSGSLYRVTLKAAMDLDLPLVFKGRFAGRKIPFAKG